MKKIAAACMALLGTCAMAQTSSVTLYGIMDLGVRHASGLTAAHAPASASTNSVGSGLNTTSRWGFRGTEDLGGGMAAVFNLEGGLNADVGAPANSSKFFDRASWVGLQSGWGTVSLGRQTTLLADAVSPVDPLGMRFANFNPNIGVTALSQHGLGIEYGSAGSNSGSYRLDNSIKYTGRWGGWTGRAMLGMGEVAGSSSALASRGVSLAYAANGLTVTGAYQTFKNANRLDLDAAMVGAAYNWGSVRLSANAGRSKAETAAGRFTVQRVLAAGVTWAMTDQVDLIATYYNVDRTRTGLRDDGYGRWVGFAEYKLSRRTKLYAGLDSTQWRRGYQGAANKANGTGVSTGLVHTF